MSDNNQPTLSATNVDVTLVDDTHVTTEAETNSTDVLPAESTSTTPPPADEGETESYDSAEEDDDDDSDDDSEYETVDLAQSELYQVLNLFLSRSPTEDQDDDEPTENVADVLNSLRESVDNLTATLQTAVSTLATASASASSSSSHKSSSSVRRHRTKKSSSS